MVKFTDPNMEILFAKMFPDEKSIRLKLVEMKPASLPTMVQKTSDELMAWYEKSIADAEENLKKAKAVMAFCKILNTLDVDVVEVD